MIEIYLKSDKRMFKKKQCIATINEYRGMINSFLNQGAPLIASTKEAIKQLQQLEKLELFMKETNYFLFDWSIEHEHLDLLTYLLKVIRPEHHLLMVSHDDYKPVKNFIINTTKMNYSEYQKAAGVKRAILEQLFLILDTDVIKELKNDLIKDSSECNKETTVDAFRADFDNLFSSKENHLVFISKACYL